jgi:hypothetical protein
MQNRKFLNRVWWYVNAMINGSPIEVMRRRHPDLEVELTDDSFVFRLKQGDGVPAAKVTNVVASPAQETLDMTVPEDDERRAAEQVAKTAKKDAAPIAPLTTVE